MSSILAIEGLVLAGPGATSHLLLDRNRRWRKGGWRKTWRDWGWRGHGGLATRYGPSPLSSCAGAQATLGQ